MDRQASGRTRRTGDTARRDGGCVTRPNRTKWGASPGRTALLDPPLPLRAAGELGRQAQVNDGHAGDLFVRVLLLLHRNAVARGLVHVGDKPSPEKKRAAGGHRAGHHGRTEVNLRVGPIQNESDRKPHARDERQNREEANELDQTEREFRHKSFRGCEEMANGPFRRAGYNLE